MARLPRKFSTLGLRREKNLSDVENREITLNGLLNNLVNDPDPAKQFTSQDLDAIRGLQNSNITVDKLSVLADITVRATNPNSTNLPVEVSPLVRINDRIENVKVVTGELPAILGGDGLTATFIPSTGINAGTTSSTGSTIFTIPPNPIREVYWDSGFFNLPSSIDPTFKNQYGAIQWEGYFVPRLRDSDVRIFVASTGLTMFEIDPADNGSWQTQLNIYAAERTIPVSSVESGNTVFVIGASNVKFASVNDVVNPANNTVVTVVGTDRITVSAPFTNPSGSITLRKTLGSTKTTSEVRLPSVEIGKQIKVRISFWFPNTGLDILEKLIEFSYIGGNVPYNYFYSVKPSSVLQPLEIRQSLLNALSPFQNNVGVAGGTQKLFVSNSLLLTYEPVLNTLAGIRRSGPDNVIFDTTTNMISGAGLTTASKGNVIVPTNPASTINNTFRIKDIFSSQLMVVDTNLGINATESVNIIEHRGLVGWFKATSSGATVTLTNKNTSDILRGFVVITAASAGYIRVVAVTSSTQFTTSSNLNLTGTEIIYIYSDRSLIDRSKEVFCAGVFGRIVGSNAAAGASQITLTSVADVAIGQYVQFDGSIPANTTVTGISGNIISISQAIITGKPIASSNTVVFVPAASGGTINREGCIVPLDTAPPFSGTAAGLTTNLKNIKSSPSVATLSVTADVITTAINSANISAPSPLDTNYNKRVLVKAKIGSQFRNFSILSIKV